MRLPTALLALAFIAAACGSAKPPAVAHPEPHAQVVGLAPIQSGAPPGVVAACAGIGGSLVLAGNAADKRVAWLEPFGGGGGHAFDLVWPGGYAAQFDPDLEILDERGNIVMRAGDFVDGGCVTAHEDVLGMAPPFLSLRLLCGPMAVPDCSGLAHTAARVAGWPDRDIAEVEFLDRNGRFAVTYEDGSKGTGTAFHP